MSAESVVIVAFSITSACRLLAYMPQIVLLSNDSTGARSVSRTTWIMFFTANAATASYAAVVAADIAMVVVFVANTLCCGAIVALLYRSRWRSCR